ncbi:hypothetical protein INT48_005748 [Thamnidium elegans]|uniref:Uncharacterized protein n=1 Tax=Thamnidium elegans TaxID=101142 RepID=A0A8H7SVY2_9FUNG|nr:hypothetical protein INT48_005748 [Thamnidium elegans]
MQLVQQSENRLKVASHLQISPPILQHSTSIYSLVSPTRTAFSHVYSKDNGKEIPFELYQPLSPPPPIPQQKSPYTSLKVPNSISPAPRKINPARREYERPMHPLDLVPDMSPIKERNHNRTRNADRRTVATDPREQISEEYVMAATSNTGRRHSCSSTVIYKQQQQDIITVKQPKCELIQIKSFRSKLRERRRSSKVCSTSSAAATIASIEEPCVEASRSTPLRKVKTYNVPKKSTTIDVEKQRKMQELEDLITGRRGSTLKLTLTPKGLS